MLLSNYTAGRDNNFNIIRMFAAYAVLVTHSYAVAIGTSNAEPLQTTLGMTIGHIAVDVFFLTSGFLVTASLLTRQSTIEFFWARVLRIYPALIAMHVITVIVIGLSFTTLPWASYITDHKLHTYFIKCLVFVTGDPYELPGVFENNPYKNSINNSLWTIPFELMMYVILGTLWAFLGISSKHRSKVFEASLVAFTVVDGTLIFISHFNGATSSSFIQLSFMFFSGASFFILKDKIVLSSRVFYGFLLALLLSILYRHAFYVIYELTLGYILFYLAYVPSGLTRNYNKLGDYSYGIYIYAFPVQQSIAAAVPGISAASMIAASSLITLVFAVASWHLLEKQALRLKGRLFPNSKNRNLQPTS